MIHTYKKNQLSMFHNLLPIIVKHPGSLKYARCIVTRLKSSASKPPSAKVLASASSAAPATKSTKPKASTAKDVIRHDTQKDFSEKTSPVEEKTESGSKIDAVFAHLKTVKKLDLIASADSPQSGPTNENVKLLNSVKPADLEWHRQTVDVRLLPKYYKSLAKIRLSGLVVLTTLAGYAMAPGVLEPVTLLYMTVGTGLTSAAANAINQVMEVPYDSQMTRTKNRVLIRGYLTPLHASMFAACSATLGLTTLYFGANSLTASLGLANLVLYTCVYTPMKRYSIANTWLGSIVGAIPPLMGWAASCGSLNAGAFIMAAILYSWQFPHFNALSWNLRAQYSRAGYRMTSVINPGLCRTVALRHSVALLGLCTIAPLVDLTTWTFAFDSLPLNCYLIYCAHQFYRRGDSESSRKLFRLSLIYLPALMFLMIVGKKRIAKDDVGRSIS